MSLEVLYNWQPQSRDMIQTSGDWQSLGLAMYGWGMVWTFQDIGVMDANT